MYTLSKKYGLVKSTAYRNWIALNLPLVKEGLDKAEKFPLEVEITIVEGYGFHDKADIDNTGKALLDLLTRAEIIPDDNIKFIIRCQEKFMSWHNKKSQAITYLKYIESDE